MQASAMVWGGLSHQAHPGMASALYWPAQIPLADKDREENHPKEQ